METRSTDSQGLSSPRQPNRRDFTKQTSAVVLGGLTAASAAAAPVAAEDAELKIAVIGGGGRGSGAAIQALLTSGKTRLWAIADAFEPNARRALRRIGRGVAKGRKTAPADCSPEIDVPEERIFVGLDAYQKAIDSGVDVVILATPPGFRPAHFEAAIAAGKHVFTEKPVAVDAPGIRRVLRAGEQATAKGLAVGVGLQRRHSADYVEGVRRLRDGAVGEIPLMRVYWNSGQLWVRTRADFQRAMGHEPSEMEYQVNNWYYFNWLCGDHIVEQHIHNLDVGNWIKGGHPVLAQGAGGRELRRGKDHGEIFDHHTVEYRYADGSTMLSQCRHMNGCAAMVHEVAAGTRGESKSFQTNNCRGVSIRTDAGEWMYDGPGSDPYQQEHHDLFAAIREGRPYNETKYGAESTMTAIMGRMATYSGQVVTWDEAIASEIDLSPADLRFDATPPVTPGPDGYYAAAVPGVTKAV